MDLLRLALPLYLLIMSLLEVVIPVVMNLEPCKDRCGDLIYTEAGTAKDTGRDDASETRSIGALTGFGSAPIGFAEGYASSMGESTGSG